MKRIYVEWVDDYGHRCNGNILSAVKVESFGHPTRTVPIERLVRAELRDSQRPAVTVEVPHPKRRPPSSDKAGCWACQPLRDQGVPVTCSECG